MPEESAPTAPVTADGEGEADRTSVNFKPSPRPRNAPAARKPSPFPRTVEPEAAEETAEAEDDAETDEPSPETVAKPPSRRLAITIVASCVAIVVLVAAGGVLWYLRAQHDTRTRDTAITAAARNEVVALLTLTPGKEKETLDQVLAGATGGWRQEFAAKSDQFTQVVSTGKVQSQATISASAIQSTSDDRATVLVSASAVIRNSSSPQGYPGVYRVLLVLEHQNDRWLVSDLQFVA